MKNLERILKKVNAEGYMLGCYDRQIDKLNNQNLKKVLDNIRWKNDVKVFLNRKPYIVQLDEIDGEIDFNMISLSEYENRYGTWED